MIYLMKKALLFMTHKNSGYEKVCDTLVKESYIDQFSTSLIYNHPDAFLELLRQPHKNETSRSIYLEVITQNSRVSCKEINKFQDICKIIYFIVGGSGVRLYGLNEYIKRTSWAFVFKNNNYAEMMDYLTNN